MAIRKRTRRRTGGTPDELVVSHADLQWWAKLKPCSMFSDAWQEVKILGGDAEVVWHKGATRLTVRVVAKAVRKRNRRNK
jgi:hypothetical protein